MANPPFVHIPDDLIYLNDIFHWMKKRYENEEQECEKICVLVYYVESLACDNQEMLDRHDMYYVMCRLQTYNTAKRCYRNTADFAQFKKIITQLQWQEVLKYMTDVTQFGLGGNMLQESRAASDIPQMLHALESSAMFRETRNIITMKTGTIKTETMVHIPKRLATYCTAKTSVNNKLQKLHISDNETVTSNCHNVY